MKASRAARAWDRPAAVFAVVFFGVFLVALVGLGVLYAGFPVLYDVDSYYHLGVARVYARVGVVDDFPWARLSLFRDGFGDKEVLFHLLLAPFARGEAPAQGGRWALALFGALALASLAGVGARAVGRWASILPLLAFAGSLDALGRLVRLRPELLGLALLLVATALAATGRFRLLGLTAFVYTLAYTAFQAFLGLAGLWLLVRWVRCRELAWPLFLYPLLGCGLALVVHPHFPHNLLIWKVQNVDFFRFASSLDVGTEIRRASPLEIAAAGAPWLLGLVALAVAGAGRRLSSGDDGDPGLDGLAETSGVAAVVFSLLYLSAIRFAIYAVPFTVLAGVAVLARRGGRLVDLGSRRGRLVAALLAVALGWGTARSAALLAGMRAATGPLPREVDWAAFGEAVPRGARVAADWGPAELYFFWAPQGFYLNVLDPVFMAVPYPDAYRSLRRLLDGREPDVPLVVVRDLESDHLAFSAFHPSPLLPRRVAGDPRLPPLYAGLTRLHRVAPSDAFVVDWRVAPAGAEWPPGPAAELEEWAAWPRSDDPQARAVEAFVDLRRLALGERCARLVHRFELAEAATRAWELAPWGPTRAWLDGRLVAEERASRLAVLGEGIALGAELTPGRHLLAVESCRAGEAAGDPAGFLLRRREDRAPPRSVDRPGEAVLNTRSRFAPPALKTPFSDPGGKA